MNALRELLIAFGLDVETGPLEHAGAEVESFIGRIKQVGSLVAEAFAFEKIKSFVESQIAAGAELRVMSERLGLSTDDLQAYELAAGQAGVGVEAMTTALRFLNRNLGEAVSGSAEAAKKFSDLSIKTKNADGTTRSAADVMSDLADKIAKVGDPAKATKVAMELLGRGGAELVPILLRGGDAFAQARLQMQALGGGLSGEFIEQAHEAEAANVRLAFAMSGLKSQIAAALLPTVAAIVDWITKATASTIQFLKHTEVLRSGLAALALVASLKVGASLMGLGRAIGLLKPSILETVAAFGRFALPIALAAVAYLLWDDFWTLMSGGKSVIGDDIDAMWGLGASQVAVQYLTAAWKDLASVISAIGTLIKDSIGWSVHAAIAKIASMGKALRDVFSGKAIDVDEAEEEEAPDAEQVARTTRLQAALKTLMGADHNALGDLLQQRAADAQFGPDIGPGTATVGKLSFGAPAPAAQGRVDVGKLTYGAPPQATQPSTPGIPAAQGRVDVGRLTYGAPTATGQTVSVPATGYGGPPLDAAQRAALQIVQTNTTQVTVHTSSEAPEAVGKAVGAGVASSQQKANNNAYSAAVRP